MPPRGLRAATAVAALAITAARSAGADEEGPRRESSAALEATAGASLVDSRGWIGLDGGARLGPGFGLSAVVAGRSGDEVLTTRLGARAAVGAGLEDGVLGKADDEVSWSGSWLHEWTEWLGTVASIGAESSLFAGIARTDVPTTYRLSWRDGREDRIERQALRLTAPLSPLHLDAGLSAVLRPVEVRAITVHLGVGAQARVSLAEGALASRSGPEAPVRELEELADVAQLGPGGGVDVTGTIEPLGLAYRAHGGALVPALDDGPAGDADDGLLARMLVELGASARLPIAGGLALEQSFRAALEPLLFDAFQVQVGLRAIYVVGASTGPPALARAAPRGLR